MTAEGPTDIQFQRADEGGACFEVAVLTGPDTGRTVRVDASRPGRALIGQSAAADLPLNDRMVSRRHLAIEVKGTSLRVEDLDSTNGTFIGGVRIVLVLLHGGEHVALGKSMLAVTRVASNAALGAVPAARGYGRVVGSSLAMRRLYPMLERLSASNASLLLEGETGTGKELIAETLHERGPRAGGPFVVLDCASLTSDAGAAVILGDAREATEKQGVFEAAHDGTLVLDEVGELPLELQPLLLRALERGEIQRVGDDRPRKVAVRVIATTRLDLDRAIQEGSFRDDLFYRLATTRLDLPPLRERDGDVGVLARYFWGTMGGDPAAIPYEAFEALERGSYPGNVRELMAAVTRLITMGVANVGPDPASAASLRAFCRSDVPYARAKEELLLAFEREYVVRMVDLHGNVQRAAAASGLALRYFQLLRAKHRGE